MIRATLANQLRHHDLHRAAGEEQGGDSGPSGVGLGELVRNERDDPRSRGRECSSARLETGVQLTTLGNVWASQLRCRLPATSRPSSWKAAIQASWVPWTLAETTRCAVCAPGTNLLAPGGSLMSKMGSIARHLGLP